MSLQDESFPDDEFLSELTFSPNVHQFQFLHHHRVSEQQPTASTNTSSSSTDQNVSTESSNGRPSSALSSKTNASDPTGLADNESKKPKYNENKDHNNKAISYQDIHSEYTKRRYKHVESKVGKYIASMKAEDDKRRSNSSKFQRHQSMPETLSDAINISAVGAERRTAMRFSADALNNLEEYVTSDVDGDAEADLSENTTEATTSASPRVHAGQHLESSNDDVGDTAINFIDKLTYDSLLNEKERIQSYNEYLQTKLDEKAGENMRLKRNVDFMRIELSSCKDKLKKQTVTTMGSSYGRHAASLQTLMYCQTKMTQATQTEPPTPLCGIFVTPNTPTGSNNIMFESGEAANKMTKNVATIQPLSLNFSNIVAQDSAENVNRSVLRQRTNSNASNRVELVLPINNSHASCPSSSDSAIDIESAELPSPHPNTINRQTSQSRQKRNEEFIYYDKHSCRYAPLATLTASPTFFDELNTSSLPTPRSLDNNMKKKNSLRRRWLRFFGPCTRCDDPNQSTLDSSAMHQTYTQIPLLSQRNVNHGRNMR